MLICVEFQMRKCQNVTHCKNEFLQRQTFLMNKSVILQYFLAKFSQKFWKKSVNKISSSDISQDSASCNYEKGNLQIWRHLLEKMLAW
jgi:hypothetical protein